ncbi:MAG: hypothetical protein EOM67_09180 [Spirochaetia bacterium]|nr:hypothetical protein [Spirochaetia bacterium]
MVSLESYRKGRRTNGVGDLTSLIDVIFLLLIFFLLTSVTTKESASELIETKSSSAPLEVSEIIYIKVGGENRYSIDETSYTLNGLLNYFEKEGVFQTRPLGIIGEETSLYTDVLNSITPLIERGWSDISFVVE